MQNFVADVRYTFRMMAKNRTVTMIAVAALALGIGANTAIFTVINAVLLEPLPYSQPERLVQIGRKFPQGYGWSSSIPKYMVWRQNHVLESMTLFNEGGVSLSLTGRDRPEPVKGCRVSRDYFRVFGAEPLIGRSFIEAEDLPDGPRVVVLSYGLWQSRFGGDRQIVGRIIPLSGEPYSVIGVMPATFHSDPEVDAWIPLQADPNSTNQGHFLKTVGRLKPGITLAAAQAEMKLVGEQFRRAYPQWMDKNEGVAVVPLREATVEDAKTPLYVLLGAVLLVLLIACANVANLLLARAAGRQREMAIRAAIGASRGMVLRQLLTESILLAGLGGVLGFALGSWGVRALLVMVPGNIPRLTNPAGQAVIPPLDWRVAAFTVGMALLTGVVFGLFPALHTSKPDLVSNLKEGGRSGSGVRHTRARSTLVIAEMALALVLLIGAVLLIRTFVGLRTVNPGFEAHNILTMTTSMAGNNYSTTAKMGNFVRQVVERLEALPGVESASASIMLPTNCCIDLPFNLPDKPPAKGDRYNGDEQWRSVSPHYFRVFRIPLLRGRAFAETDSSTSARVVIINEAMVRKYWPKEDPIGKVLLIGKGLGPEFEEPPRQIVGIVGDAREAGLSKSEIPVIYVPQGQIADGLIKLANNVLPLSWAIRGAANPTGLRSAIEREIQSIDPQISVGDPRLMEEVVSRSISRDNFMMLLLTIFAAIALLLAAIGIYGLMSYSVEQRTQEIGVRMALGAGKPDLLRMILRQGLQLAAAGVLLGLAIAYGLTRVLASLLFGVQAADPFTFGGVAMILLLIALAATWYPARRAAAVEPVEALRYQ
jgi:putative ABC transport system permease protein